MTYSRSPPRDEPAGGPLGPRVGPFAVAVVGDAGGQEGRVIGVIGVFPPQVMTAPIGDLQQRNLTIRGGNCNHRKYIPKFVDLVATGAVDPTSILTQTEPVTDAIEAYEVFHRSRPGWLNVQLDPAA